MQAKESSHARENIFGSRK